MQDKANLRHTLLAARLALAAELRAEWDVAIGKYLDQWLAQHPAKILGVYLPIQNEPDLRAVYSTLAAHGMQLALPVVATKAAPLKFLDWKPGDRLTKDRMGISVPFDDSPQVQPDALLLPCVGFNRAKIRLGYGGGHYDRTLAHYPDTLAIGIAYSCAAVDFDAELHDVALDTIITEDASRSIA